MLSEYDDWMQSAAPDVGERDQPAIASHDPDGLGRQARRRDPTVLQVFWTQRIAVHRSGEARGR